MRIWEKWIFWNPGLFFWYQKKQKTQWTRNSTFRTTSYGLGKSAMKTLTLLVSHVKGIYWVKRTQSGVLSLVAPTAAIHWFRAQWLPSSAGLAPGSQVIQIKASYTILLTLRPEMLNAKIKKKKNECINYWDKWVPIWKKLKLD